MSEMGTNVCDLAMRCRRRDLVRRRGAAYDAAVAYYSGKSFAAQRSVDALFSRAEITAIASNGRTIVGYQIITPP